TLFASCNLLGDTLVQTPALRIYKEQHPNEEITWVLQDQVHVREICSGMVEQGVADQILFEKDLSRFHEKRFEGYDKTIFMGIEYIWPLRIGYGHMSQAFGSYIGVQVPDDMILPAVGSQYLTPDDYEFYKIPDLSRCLVISPYSTSKITSSQAGTAGMKVVPWDTWYELIQRFKKTLRISQCIVLAGPGDESPPFEVPVLRLPLGKALAVTYTACSLGGAYAGVENGFTHACTGMKIPTFCIHPMAPDPGWASYYKFNHYKI